MIRDYDSDAILDFNNGQKQIGNFGINIHRAQSTGTTKSIDKYSAGCQVLKTQMTSLISWSCADNTPSSTVISSVIP
ncbi:MAG: hypothetical protein U5K54_15525 [Cytophagales bacterium]|nr:hypothetical protein [Cytophagales bacterium]